MMRNWLFANLFIFVWVILVHCDFTDQKREVAVVFLAPNDAVQDFESSCLRSCSLYLLNI